MSMSWADLDSYKVFAPMIEVNEFNYIPIHVHEGSDGD
jgi:hypothetical protein